MKYDPKKHHRRSIRLKGYDYHNAGAYFVTICTKNRICVLDDPIIDAIIWDVWMALPKWFPTVALDEFVIMPNHVHFVVWILTTSVGIPLAGILDIDHYGNNQNHDKSIQTQDGGKPHPHKIPDPQKINTAPALGDVVGGFKSLVFKVYLDWIEVNDPFRRAKFWQSNYYEHIVRNDRELNAIRQYIIDNPVKWKMDRDNLKNERNLPPPDKVDDYLEDLKELMTGQDHQE